jgi:hypothetical protein
MVAGKSVSMMAFSREDFILWTDGMRLIMGEEVPNLAVRVVASAANPSLNLFLSLFRSETQKVWRKRRD